MAIEIQKRRYIADINANETDDNNDKRIKRAKHSEALTKILQLNDDCFEKLFSYLELKDLGNIVMSNSRLSTSATYVFKRFHAETLIVFDPFASNRRIYENFINILEGFGDSIQRLSISFYHQHRYHNRNQRMLDLIVEKCSKSVVELSLHNVKKDMIISKPFVNLQKLTFNDSYFNDSMSHFIQISRNIVSLEFYAVENVFHSNFVEQQIPLMEHFANYDQVITDSEIENLQNFRRFVNANRQLNSLGIGAKELEMIFRYGEIRQQFFKTIHRKLPFPDRNNHFAYLLPFESIYFGNLKQLNISLGYSTEFLRCMRERRLLIENLPLEQLSLYVSSLNMETVDFLVQCHQLRKLQLYVCERLEYIHVVASAMNLHQLIELELILLYDENPKCSAIPEVMRVIIENCKCLKKIVVGFEIKQPSHNINNKYREETAIHYGNIFENSFSVHLPNEWHANFVSKNLEIKRQHSREPFILCAILEHNSNLI